MYARVITGRLKLATLDRGLTILEGQVRPHVAARPGFQRWELLVERETGRFQAISHWGSLVEAEGASRDGFTDRAGMLAGLLEEGVAQTLFEVRA
jgi:hypothetical protein